MNNIEDTNFVFSWTVGVISRMSNRQQTQITKKKKVCASCGKQKPLIFEKLSGAQKSYFCEECGCRYVESAKRLEEERKKYFD